MVHINLWISLASVAQQFVLYRRLVKQALVQQVEECQECFEGIIGFLPFEDLIEHLSSPQHLPSFGEAQ